MWWYQTILTKPNLRVEICVVAYARVVDWHAYKNLVESPVSFCTVAMRYSALTFLVLLPGACPVKHGAKATP